MADWLFAARSPGPEWGFNGALPIVSISATIRHLAVSAAVVTTPFTPTAWALLAKGAGITLQRNGRRPFGGIITERRLTWDADNSRSLIKVSALGDEQLLADRIAFPDPLRAPDDQTVNDYWTFTGTPSGAMLALISDQAGPTCITDRRVPGLVLGPDPGVGSPRGWQALYTDLLSTLSTFSVSSGTDLGVRLAPSSSGLVASLYTPRDLTSAVTFSADIGNLVGIDYVEAAPAVTDPVSAGQGDLHMRLRRYATSSSPLNTAWGRRIWSYIDRRDTADTSDLDQANSDAMADGVATVSLAMTLTDTDAATYGRDWDLGDKVTAAIGLPGQQNVAHVADVVREIRFDVDERGAETLRPAVGTADAKAVIPPPSMTQLAAIGDRLTNLITRK